MRKILTLFPLLFAFVALCALPDAAEAKRLGGGQSMGKQYSVPSQPSAPAAPGYQQKPGYSAPAAGAPSSSGASRWLGPLAGLAAGGLLGALLFGDAFEGFQFMDFLLIAALIFGAVMLMRLLRGRAPQAAQPQPAVGPVPMPNHERTASPSAGGTANWWQNLSGTGVAAPAPGQFEAPAWFDRNGFVEGSKGHFIRLQAAWDKGDMKDIAEYTTPELFAAIQAERLREGGARNFTEVVKLDAELVGVQRDGDKAVASIRFSGLIREEQGGLATEFAEVWHVVHGWDSLQGDWFVAGIQQQS